ncbi:high mobility group protein 20A [Agrilus planipennis]|uniref:High mobility group protein 20A n=1 Tax=Agrilus planipennis TaxID=224129 RepID=A0A1W4XKQ6_AGRPL|nr:high mobility group protein 20A [Agrilus planipennis]XP_018332961.1 high mobility group protein 20A [Agrilus planipennis]
MENTETVSEISNTPSESNKQVKPKQNISSDEKAPDSSDNSAQKQKAIKGKKRKRPKDATAPRHPLTGYVRYLNDRRESVRAANPNLPFSEITKILASEWSSLPSDKKQQYLDAAEQDRERYTREYNAYKQTEAYKLFTQQQHEKKMKENKEEIKPQNIPQQNSLPAKEKDLPINNNEHDAANFDIPIFTEEFLDHNKTRDVELRQLRKSNIDYEQQNAILQKHIENMKSAIEKLENDISQQKKHNNVLQQHLDEIKATLANGFSNVKLPGGEEGATLPNIEVYMTNLHSILLENNSQDATFIQNVRDIVGRLEFNG